MLKELIAPVFRCGASSLFEGRHEELREPRGGFGKGFKRRSARGKRKASPQLLDA